MAAVRDDRKAIIGKRFTARHGTHSFLAGRTIEEDIALARRMKELAGEVGRAVKTYTVFTLIAADTDAQANELLDYYRSGADVAAVRKVTASMFGDSGKLCGTPLQESLTAVPGSSLGGLHRLSGSLF